MILVVKDCEEINNCTPLYKQDKFHRAEQVNIQSSALRTSSTKFKNYKYSKLMNDL